MAQNKSVIHWRVNTHALIEEVLKNPGTGILIKPMQIFGRLLAEVAERAIELNDPKLNALMCRLALYEQSDPYSPEYDRAATEEVIGKFF